MRMSATHYAGKAQPLLAKKVRTTSIHMTAPLNGLSLANMGGLLSRSVAPQVQGEILGIGSSIAALANSLPPLIGGYVANWFAPGVRSGSGRRKFTRSARTQTSTGSPARMPGGLETHTNSVPSTATVQPAS